MTTLAPVNPSLIPNQQLNVIPPTPKALIHDNKPQEGMSTGAKLGLAALGLAAVGGAVYFATKGRMKLSPKVFVEKFNAISDSHEALLPSIKGMKLSEAKAFLKQSTEFSKYKKLKKEIKPTLKWINDSTNSLEQLSEKAIKKLKAYIDEAHKYC